MQMWPREGHTRGRWVEAEAKEEAEAIGPRRAVLDNYCISYSFLFVSLGFFSIVSFFIVFLFIVFF